MSASWLEVWKIKYNIAFPDPDMPPGRYHHAIFVRTSKSNGSGELYHVIGDITSPDGMSYQRKPTRNPDNSETFFARDFLGYTLSSGHPAEWDKVLGNLLTPPQQKAPNPAKMGRTEPFKSKVGPYKYIFYEDGEERKPLWKCTEWVEDYALPALYSHGLIQAQIPDPNQGQSSSSHSRATVAGEPEWVWDEEYQRYRYWDATNGEWVWDE